jgi:peptide/nickel transport system substrate-binding protein
MALKGLGAAALASTAAAQTAPRRGGVLTTVYSTETQTIFAPGGGGGNPLLVSSKILERLVRDEGGSFSGQLAESWQVQPDGRAITFRLRRNATWHDGTPFTADDVVFNATDHWRPVAGNPTLRAISGATAIDPHTMRLEFGQPTPESLALASLGGTETQVIPRHLYAGTDLRTNPRNNAPIGTGPFRFREWRRGSHVELVRNETYWEAGAPHLDGIIIRYLQDPQARSAAFEAGEAQLGVGSPFPAAEMRRLMGTNRFDATDRGGLQEFMVIEMNTRTPQLADRRVRQAIAHAIDRAFIVDVAMNGFGRVGFGTVSDAYPTFFTRDVPVFGFDTRRAEALLDEAGHRRPRRGAPRFELRLVAAPWYAENVRTGQYLQQALDDVGIRANLTTPDRAGAIREIYQAYAFDLSVSNNVSYADPLMRSTMLYTTENITGTPFRNASGYSNPELDRLVAEAAREMDAAKRVQLLHRVQRIAAEDVPVLVPAYKQNMTFAHRRVRNHSMRPEWMYDAWKDVWLDA